MRPAMRPALLVSLLLASGLAAGAAPPKAVPRQLYDRAERQGSVRVLVELAIPTVPEGGLTKAELAVQEKQIAGAQRAVRRLLRGTEHAVGRSYRTIPFLAARVDPDALDALARSPRVRRVTEDRLSAPALLDSVPIVQADRAHAAGFDGAGWAVAVLDTGTERSHPFLGGRVVEEACFSAEGHCPNGSTSQSGTGAGAPCRSDVEGCDHGTHVAGIAAGDQGVAKGAAIVAVNVFSIFEGEEDCGEGGGLCTRTYDSDQVAALEHVLRVADRRRIAAVNMSLGGGRFTARCDGDSAAHKTVIDHLRSRGIATVIATGNDGYTDSISSPACVSSAVSVGATDKSDDVADFSNSASFVSLLAPGKEIQSSVFGGAYGYQSGTSQATPHVAGAWAILKQAAPDASVDRVLSALQQTGQPVTDGRNGISRPRIRIESARQALAGGGGPGPGGCGNDLCLLGKRFRVRVDWRNPYNGQTGVARALPQTDYVGYFTFGDPNNIELTVKMLDFGNVVKLFYGELTDFQFQITVTDTRSGTSKSYGPGPSHCGSRDDAAFPGIQMEFPDDGEVKRTPKDSCVPGGSVMCLLDGRFSLEVAWRNQYNGAQGLAIPSVLSRFTGGFAFDDPANKELLAKVLDFGNRRLFFFGAMSNLEYEIAVLDHGTGRLKYFYNPPGKYCGGSDTNF